MIKLCRLCFSVNKDDAKMYKLTEKCDIDNKIRSCFSLNLIINEAFPDHMCYKCVNKIEEIYDLHNKIKENEQKLQKHLQEGTLVNYYLNLTNEFLIKEENREDETQIVFTKNSIVKNEDIEIKNDQRKRNIDNKINEIQNENKKCKINEMYNEFAEANKKISKDIEVVKTEDESMNNDFNEAVYSSSDEEENVILSSLKNIEDSTDKTININSKSHKKQYNIEKIKNTDSEKSILDKYSCLMCDRICNSHNKLKAHYHQDHTDKIDQTSEPKYTETFADSKTKYKCDQCDKLYSKKYMKRHMLSHINKRPYVCKICTRSYRTVSDIMRHGFRVHSGLKLLCPYKCGFSSAYTGAIKEHEDRVHKYKFKYTCEKCGKGFQVKTWFNQHQNIHTGLKPYVCDICGASFHMDKYLKTHCATIHPQSTDLKRLICTYCNLKCETENILETHLKTEHGIIRTKRDRKKRKTLCDLCGKILNRPEELVVHRRMHFGERPYKCSICSKSFPRKFSMQVHERAHSRARSHACATCGRAYSQPSALYRHQRKQHSLPRKNLKTGDDI